MKLKNYAPTGRYLFYVLLTALLIGISGCGGGGSGSTSSGGSSTGSTASGSAQ
jgi:hypothetical protein